MKNLKFLLAFLNSTAVYKIFNFFYAGGGLEGEIKINRLEFFRDGIFLFPLCLYK